MHDSACVRGGDRIAERTQHPNAGLHPEVGGSDVSLQGGAGQVLHDQQQAALVPNKVEDLDDIRMLRCCERARLTFEPGDRVRVEHGGRRDPLDGDEPVQGAVPGEQDDAEGAPAQFAHELEGRGNLV